MPSDFLEVLEERRLLSASLTSGVLTVGGTSGKDTITVSLSGANLVCKVDGVSKSFSYKAVNKIVVNAGAGNDSVVVGGAITKPATLNGGDGNDSLTGGGGNDRINGGNGNDTEVGGAGNDIEDGGAGNDSLDGGNGNDTETGDAGNDTETGDAGDDTLDGGDGNDSLNGGGGSDTLLGKAGVNLLRGGTGADHFISGGGSDVITDHESDDDGEDAGEDGPGDLSGAVGTLSAVDPVASTITVSVFGDKAAATPKTFTVTADTKITANDTAITLADLKTGLKVAVTASATDPMIAASVVVVGAHTEGKVSAVTLATATTPATITLKGEDGKPDRTFNVSPTATITIAGVAGTIDQVVVGSEVGLQLSALDPTTAVAIRAGGEGGDGGDDHGGDDHHDTAAAVVSTDAVAGTITVNIAGATTPATFTVDPKATITVDGAAATLDTLPAGLNVKLTFSATDATVVTAISAVGPEAEGKVTAVAPATATTPATISLKGHDGQPDVTYTVSATATVKIGDTVGTLAGIPLGADVQLRLSALDGTTVVSIKVDD